MDLTQYLSFIVCWLGLMAVIGIALLITGKFGKKGDNSTVDPKEYAERFEAEQNAATPEKPIKKQFRNPFYLSEDEKIETLESTKESTK